MKLILEMTLRQTQTQTCGTIGAYMKVLMKLIMLEEHAHCDSLVETRMEIVLLPLMERIQRLIDRRTLQDDVFLHLGMKIILFG